MNETAIQVYEPAALPDRATVTQRLKAIQEFQEVVRRTLIEGHDYGTIPGTPKPTLYKPGAEKLIKILGLSDGYEITQSVEQWDKPFFAYTVRCVLTSMETGRPFASGLGSCNSYESKYRYRNAARKCPECGKEAIIKGKAEYGGGWVCFKKKDGCGAKFADKDQSIEGQQVGRVENEDICDQVNTFLKMAKKRAMVDAALSAGRLSDLFTQDLDDMPRAARATVEPPHDDAIDGEYTEAPPERPAPRANGAAPSDHEVKTWGDLLNAVERWRPKTFKATGILAALKVTKHTEIKDFNGAFYEFKDIIEKSEAKA